MTIKRAILKERLTVININKKYIQKNQHLDYLIDPSFQGLNRPL